MRIEKIKNDGSVDRQISKNVHKIKQQHNNKLKVELQ
jgi:hypothetical protein